MSASSLPISRGCAATGYQLKKTLGMKAVLPWLFNLPRAEACRPDLLTFNLARDGDMVTGNDRGKGTRLYCHWDAKAWCYETSNRRCGRGARTP